jgi:hypothetical protein
VACPSNSNAPSGSATCLCNQGYTGPDGGPCQACGAGTYKDSPGSGACSSCPSSVLSYSSQGGPMGQGYVSFNRQESDFLDTGTRTFNFASNGGLTIVTVVRFVGSPGNWERIVDFGNGMWDNNIVLTRQGTSSVLRFFTVEGLQSGSESKNFFIESPSGTITQDTWLTIIARYDASTLRAELTVDGAVVGTATASAALTDKILTKTYAGKSNWGSWDDYLNADMAGLVVLDQHLDLETATALADSMKTLGRGE